MKHISKVRRMAVLKGSHSFTCHEWKEPSCFYCVSIHHLIAACYSFIDPERIKG